MNERWINRQLRRGIYYTHLEYWVAIADIVISDAKKEEKINERRFKREKNYINQFGLYETRILLDRNFNLIDGYISILIALDNEDDVVPVHFVDLSGQREEE